MSAGVYAIFDIGKTHKKFLLFDHQYQVISEETQAFPETTDEDGFPCDDLNAIVSWIYASLKAASAEFNITKLNFSTYGASMVHLNRNGEPLTSLYNYLKPMPKEVEKEFYSKYGPKSDFERITASPALGMLNSGLQLYWLKKTRPDVFNKIDQTLHFPNYLSYLFTRKAVAEKTSLGCHTAMWDFDRNQYHAWVSKEGLTGRLPPIQAGTEMITAKIHDRETGCGTGLHDSSAALVPYQLYADDPFVLLSTGTWNIALNPFCSGRPLTQDELDNDTLYFMNYKGDPVKANRLFLGNEHDRQNQILCTHFHRSRKYHRGIVPDHHLLTQLGFDGDLKQHLAGNGTSLSPLGGDMDPTKYDSYELAYHALNLKLSASQALSIERVLEEADI